MLDYKASEMHLIAKQSREADVEFLMARNFIGQFITWLQTREKGKEKEFDSIFDVREGLGTRGRGLREDDPLLHSSQTVKEGGEGVGMLVEVLDE